MTVLPTHVDENFLVTKFAQEEESIQEGEISHQLSVGSQLSEKQPFTDSPLSSRLDTFEGFWVNMDGKGEYIPNREEPNQGETNREESSIRTNTFEFLIQILGATHTNQMKNIPHSTLLNFHGMESEELDTFLFEFDVLYGRYDYIMNRHKLKKIPATLNNLALRCFMGLGRDSIANWA